MKRYTVQLSAYIWADSDEQAMEMADNYAKYLDAIPEMSDNRATADRLRNNWEGQGNKNNYLNKGGQDNDY